MGVAISCTSVPQSGPSSQVLVRPVLINELQVTSQYCAGQKTLLAG